MKIELRPLDQIKPYPGNPRLNAEAVDAVVKSLREFGFRQPIVVDSEAVIIVGHTRYLAAQKMELARVPVHVATDLTPAQVKAYRIADNKTGEIAEWDQKLLPIELAQLEQLDFDVTLLGFNTEELSRVMSFDVQDGLTDPDAIPAPPDAAITRPGDVWQLGKHRLMCGDSADPNHVDTLLDGERIHLVNTDPPYNVKVEPRSNNAIAAGLSSFSARHHQKFDVKRHPSKAKATQSKLRAKDRPLANDFVSDEQFDRLLDGWFGNLSRALIPGRGFYIWGGYANCGNYPPFLKKHELYFSQAIIWVKEHPVLTRKDFMGNHEWCFYGWREGAAHKYLGPNNATDVWSVKKVNPQSMIHLTEKPVDLAVRAMQYSTVANENVLDLFGGSGSTLIAAEQTKRRAFLMELDPLYCDVIVTRWAAFTGKKAERVRRGRSESGKRMASAALVKLPGKRGQVIRRARRADARFEPLTPRQKRAVETLLQEPTVVRAAVLAGVNERTLRRWMQMPAFQHAYHGVRRQAFGQAVGLMQRYSPVAVNTLMQVMTDNRAAPAARVTAAAALLRFGREGIELDDLAMRIEHLEGRE